MRQPGRWFLIALAGAAAILFVLAVSDRFRAVRHVTPDLSGYEACVERGVLYFRNLGSYPALSDGRNARVVAHERCGRSLTAF